MQITINRLRQEVLDILTGNILPYWIKKMPDHYNGGFYGQIDGKDTLIPQSEKGAILNARILWTFSSAYRLLKDPIYLKTATRAKDEIINHFYDKKYGGVFWSLDAKGTPLNTKKQIYAISFAIYGLSEYYRATGDIDALKYAIHLFHDIEIHSFDKVHNGYFEAFTCEWKEISDMRLSKKDENECKSMNTHLHILEAYTNLYRVWKDKYLKQQLQNLINLFIDKILDKNTNHLQLFFNDNWQSRCNIISYGHEIETSWLIHKAAFVMDDRQLISKIEPYIIKIADAATEGFFPEGGMIYELRQSNSLINADRYWWVQAETIIGYLNLYQHFNDKKSLARALQCWDFIRNNLIDYKNGEWYWSIYANGTINTVDDKAGFWKCPYYNSRMCMEIIERFPS